MVFRLMDFNEKAQGMPIDKKVAEERMSAAQAVRDTAARYIQPKVRFEVFGEEMLQKSVKSSGNSGRVYLPPEWVGHRVKIIRID